MIEEVSDYRNPSGNINYIVFGPNLSSVCKEWAEKNEGRFLEYSVFETPNEDDNIFHDDSSTQCPYCGALAKDYNGFSICSSCDSRWI